ncbi:MAG: OmpA family protein [Chitinophagales bacterium]
MKNLKTILIFAFSLLVLGLNATAIKTEIIYFDLANANIKVSEMQKLEKLKKANQIFLVGHTDADGDSDFNQKLSQKRVESVFNFFVENGISKEKIDVSFFGEEKPLNRNISEIEKAENRRVEIKYIIDPLMDFEVEKQVFDVKNNAETIIKAKGGTEIIIPANTFVEKNVKLELKEFYSTLDILSSNLSTKANGEMLETSGMIFLEATSEGKKVEPKNEFTIKFKKMSESQNFQLFDGNRNQADLDMNWNVLGGEQIMKKSISLDKFQRNMSTFKVEDQLGTLLNEGQFSWYSENKTNKFYTKSAPWNSWAQVFDYTNFYNQETHQCFENSSIELEIDSSGRVQDINTSFKDKKHFCNSFYREIVSDKIITDGLTGSSFMTIKFEMDFTVLDSITAFVYQENKRLQAIWKAKQDSVNDYLAEARTKRITRNKATYETNLIVTKSSKLGWINCDRFLRNIPKTDFVVKVSDEMNVRMVVKSFNSFYNGHNDYRKENHKVFTKIPLGEKVTLICTSYKDGKILLAIEETTIRKAVFSDFNFEVVSKEELKERISVI